MIDFIPVFTRLVFGLVTPLAATPAAGSAAAHATPAAAPAPAPAPTAAAATAAVDNVQKFYANVTQVSAVFSQTVTNTAQANTKTNSGNVWLAKPGKMRWDYLAKKKDVVVPKKSFISDGTTLYMVDRDNKQIVEKALGQDMLPIAVSFLYGKGDLKAEFNAAFDTTGSYGHKGDVVLNLTPKKPSAQYKHLVLVADAKDFHVKESVIVDSSDNTNHFKFFSPDFKTPIDDKYFKFDSRSEPSFKVIHADQQQGSAAGSAGPLPTPPSPAAPKKL